VSTVIGCWNNTFQHTLPATATVFFRAVSLAVYGTEEAYCQICLLAAIETLLHPDLYDKDAESYYAPYKADYCLYHGLNSYAQFVCDIAVDGSYADMHTVLAVSAVVQKPIQMRWPDERDTRTFEFEFEIRHIPTVKANS